MTVKNIAAAVMLVMLGYVFAIVNSRTDSGRSVITSKTAVAPPNASLGQDQRDHTDVATSKTEAAPPPSIPTVPPGTSSELETKPEPPLNPAWIEYKRAEAEYSQKAIELDGAESSLALAKRFLADSERDKKGADEIPSFSVGVAAGMGASYWRTQVILRESKVRQLDNDIRRLKSIVDQGPPPKHLQ